MPHTRPKSADGFSTLGEVLGGGIDREGAFLEGALLGGKTQDALAKARIRRDEAEQRLQAEEAFRKLGLAGPQAGGAATIARGGFGNVNQITQALGNIFEQSQRANIADPAMTPELGDINRALASLSTSPQAGVESVGAGLFTDIFGPQAGELQVAPTGEASIEATNQRAQLSEAKRLNPEKFRNVTNIGLGPGDVPLGDQLVDAAVGTGGIPEDIEFSEATGLPGALESAANIGVELANVIPFVDIDIPFEETDKASNALRDLARRTELLLQDFVPGRPSNILLEKLGQFSNDPGDFLRGEQRSRLRIQQTRDFIADGVAQMQNLANNPILFTRLTKTQQGKIVQQLPQAASLLKAYDTVLKKFDDRQKGTVEGAGSLEVGGTIDVAGGTITRIE